MKTFVIERDLAGVSAADLHMLAARTRRQVLRMRDDGDLVHYLGSTFLSVEGRCLCLFQAKDEAVLISLSRQANLPVDRIVVAVQVGFEACAPVGRMPGAE